MSTWHVCLFYWFLLALLRDRQFSSSSWRKCIKIWIYSKIQNVNIFSLRAVQYILAICNGSWWIVTCHPLVVMLSTRAAFHLGELNPATSLLYLHSMSGPERQTPPETSPWLPHIPSKEPSKEGGLMGQVSMNVCVHVAIKYKHSHSSTSLICSNTHRRSPLELTHTSLPMTLLPPVCVL